MTYTTFLTQVLIHTSQLANTQFGRVSGQSKGDDNNQVLTQTDLEIGQFIITELKKNYPEHNIIDEEAGIIDHGSI